jgi:creatinine amidohydrolase
MGKKKTLYLHDMNYTEVAAYLKTCDVVMVPMGSLERHGAHIPLGCDALTPGKWPFGPRRRPR